MSIVAALCFFDEPESFLDRCVRSLAGVADILLAVDGRWEHFPADYDISPAEQRRAIEVAASEVGLPYVIEASGPWESQVAKRGYMMERAAELATHILVIDADCWIESCDREALDLALADSDKDVALISVRTTAQTPRDTRRYRFLYRSSAGVTIEHAHNGYVTADGRYLHGDHAYVRPEPAEEATAEHILMLHERNARSPVRQAASREYHRARNRLGVERWPAGMRASKSVRA